MGGIARFGYSASDGELVPDEREQAVVTRMLELKADGYSLRAIAQRLNDEGLRPKRGEHLHATQVGRVLERLHRAQGTGKPRRQPLSEMGT